MIDNLLQSLNLPQTDVDPQDEIDSHWLRFSEELSEDKVFNKINKWEVEWGSEESSYLKGLNTSYNSYKNQNIMTERYFSEGTARMDFNRDGNASPY